MKQSHFIIFENYKLIYGRVPKVANSSIKASLTHILKLPPAENFKTNSDSFWRNATNGETRMIGIREAHKLRKTHFSFAFVRNPFDRLVSAYNNKIIENEGMSKKMKEMGLSHGMSFPDFVAAVSRTPLNSMDPHLLPQSRMLVFKGIVVPKFVGRFERLEDDWGELQARMTANGLNPLGKLPRRNMRRKAGGDLPTYFNSRRLVDMVEETYSCDLKYFYPGITTGQLLETELPQVFGDPIHGSGPWNLGRIARWFQSMKRNF